MSARDPAPDGTAAAAPAPSAPSYFPFPQADLRPLSQVLAVLQLEQVRPDFFTGASLPGPLDRIYGGQVMAQSLVAASRTLPEGTRRCPHSLHGYFLRMGQLGLPVEFEVERLHDGKSFSGRRVLVSQEGRAIFTFMASFQEHQTGVDIQLQAPPAPAPESLPSNSELVAKFKHPAAWMLLHMGAFDMRHVNGQVYFPSESPLAATQMVWMRARHPLPDSTPQLLHRALLAYACDQIALEPILRSTGLNWTSPGLAVASLDHAMWFHRNVDVRDWLLYVQDSPTAQGGRGLGRADIFSRAGTLVASLAQEGMVRVPE